jgi:cyclophilin family peptidyl-prolyl cis-trans isomerase
MRLFSLLLLICVFLFGCGGNGGSGGSITFNGLRIEPSTIRVKPNEVFQATGIIDGTAQPVTWSVVETAGGTVTSGGKYSAPQASGNYTLKLSLASDPTKTATALVIVDSSYVVKVNGPLSGQPTVATGEILQLTAIVQGSSSNQVTWATDLGTISTDGKLSAESLTLSAPGEANVTATSVVDPGKKTTIKVRVVPFIQVVSPNSVNNAIPGSRIKFKANIRGVESTEVNWTATEGTITSQGVWTAPSGLGSATITATSTEKSTFSATAPATTVANLNVRFTFEGRGDVVLSLRPDKAPNHCANLVSLVNEKFYDDILVHRYEAGFVVQWGDPLTKTLPLSDSSIGTGGPGYSINFEPNDLLHKQYSLGMARSTSLNSAGSQIYLCLADQPSLDGNYVVFGDTLTGQSVVDALRRGDKIVRAVVELP